MKFNTTRFGEIEVSDDSIFEFLEPILGYEDETKFVLIEHKQNSNFKWLQSAKTPGLAFVVTIAGLFAIDYSFELPETTQEKLSIETAEEILALNLVVIPHENPRNSTINLLAPIIMNTTNKKASQVVLANTDFSVSYPLLKREEVC